MFQDKCTSDDTKKADEQNLGRNQNSNKSNSVLTIFTNIVHTAQSFYKDEAYYLIFLIFVTSESQLLDMLRVFNVASPVVTTWLFRVEILKYALDKIFEGHHLVFGFGLSAFDHT